MKKFPRGQPVEVDSARDLLPAVVKAVPDLIVHTGDMMLVDKDPYESSGDIVYAQANLSGLRDIETDRRRGVERVGEASSWYS